MYTLNLYECIQILPFFSIASSTSPYWQLKIKSRMMEKIVGDMLCGWKEGKKFK